MSSHDLEVEVPAADANARRLARFALDLHDGPMQDVAALLSDLRLARVQFQEALSQLAERETLLGRIDDLEARLVSLDEGLRDLVYKIDSSPVPIDSVESAMQDLVETFSLECRIPIRLSVEGDFEKLTRSQHIALTRVVQEALANISKHSGAREAEVTVTANGSVTAEIWDDGIGFDVEQELLAAARKGRLGLVGMAERVQLLGGRLRVDSAPGGPTRISLHLPEWNEEVVATGSAEAA